MRDAGKVGAGSAPVDQAQVQALYEYIARGIDHGCEDCVGLELEHFIVRADDHALIPYLNDPETGAFGVAGILESLAPFYEQTAFETRGNGERHIIGLSRRHANITLEPGAQFEISIGPVSTIPELEAVYSAFRAELDPVLAKLGYEALTYGYHPSSSAHSIPLIPKDRYRFMDEHFRATGAHGICMMRATASAQVSVDYTSEADAVRKFRIANALGPLLAFITDNSPVFEGRRVGSGGVGPTGLAIPERMARTVIWDDVDASRSMIAPHTFDEGFDFAAYAASVLSAPAIFTLEDDGQSGDAGGGAGGERRGTGGGRQGAGGGTGGGAKRGVPQGGRSFAEALAGRELDRATIEHILSLFFFDVRFKTYIEIRMADSLPIDYALAFVALIKGLFYREGNLRRLEALLGWAEWPADLLADPLAGQPIEQPAELLAGQAAELLAGHGEQAARVDAAAVAAAKAALRSEGYGALVYQRSAAAWLDELIAMARQGLDGTEAPYLEPLARLVADRTTLVDAANDGDVASAANGGGAL